MTRLRWSAATLLSLASASLAGACSFDGSGVADDGGGGAADADPSAPDADPNAPDADPTQPDAADSCVSWPAVNVTPCDDALPDPGVIALGTGRYRYNTTTGVLTAPGGDASTPPSTVMVQDDGPDARVLVLTQLVVEDDTALIVTGTHPLLIVVHGDVTLNGTIDVSASRDELSRAGIPGPGSGAEGCAAAGVVDGDPSTGPGGGGGGGGGGYGEDGGDGGDGQGGGHGGKGSKGPKNGTDTIEPLRGGCAGGTGGDDNDDVLDGAGARGDGGGALEITALGLISVEGTIRASGTGGLAANLVRAGGGGGGSGGAILLDGETLEVTAIAALCANGGGGGEGGQLGAVTASQDGANPTCDEARAEGGATQPDGGDGGDGGAGGGMGRKGTNAANGANEAGGGGGGGSAGRIRLRGRAEITVDSSAIVSPTPTN